MNGHRLLIVLEHRFSEQDVETLRLDINRLLPHYRTAMESFGGCTIVARVSGLEPGLRQPLAPSGCAVLALPDFSGPAEMLLKAIRIVRLVWPLLERPALAITPVPAMAGLPVWFALKLRQVDHVAHVVGDAREVPGSIGISGRAGRIASTVSNWLARHHVRRATGVWYVTGSLLQQRYPSDRITVAASNVILEEAWFREPRVGTRQRDLPRVGFVGSLSRSYKGLDVLLRAVAQLPSPGVELDLIGSGSLEEHYRRMADDLGIAERITWHGQLPPSEVRDQLTELDLFVLPSRTEGMPRALIEAMALGLPCLASSVGGAVELLPQSARFEPDNVEELRQLMARVLSDDQVAADLARECHRRSLDFARQTLEARKRDFLAKIQAHLEEAA